MRKRLVVDRLVKSEVVAKSNRRSKRPRKPLPTLCGQFGSSSRLAFLLLVSSLLSLHWGSSLANGQNTAYTLKNGLLIEGVGGTVSEISVTLAFSQNDKTIVMMDNGLKRTFFSLNDVANKGESNLSDLEVQVFQRVNDNNDNQGNGILMSVGKFDPFGHRTIMVRIPTRTGGSKVVPVIQGITKITPLWTEVQTLITGEQRINSERWDMRLATSSIPADVLHNLLHSAIDPDNPLERLDIVDFYVAAEQYRRAIEEHAQIERDFPDVKQDFKASRLLLHQAYGRSILREARFRETVGQFTLASQMASAIDTSEMSPVIQEDFQLFLQEEILQVNQKIEQTKTELVDRARKFIAKNQNKPEIVKACERLANELENKLSRANLDRLATYQRLKDGGGLTPEQQLAYAISGWILGSNNATPNMGTAQSLFKVRDLVHEFLHPATPGRRVQIIEELKNYEGGEPEFLAQIINNMTPPQAPDLSNYTGETPLEFETSFKGTVAQEQKLQKFRYLVHLPPDYDPHRKYPCLLTLRAENSTEEQLERWAGRFNPKLGVRNGQAIRHGYIVVSLDWKRPGQTTYEYSAAEHKAILGCMRGMLKKFSIDSDRFFITGHGSGADAAYDVAISHPEHWAGVIGIAGKIAKYPVQYMRNAHLGLNVYSVVGTKDHGNIVASKDAWNTWLKSNSWRDGSRFNRCTVVEYIGRLAEPYFEEFPHIMDWCDVNRRSWPDLQGCEFECKVLRPWDNYFWFLEFHGMPEANIMRPSNWPANGRGFNGLKLGAKLSITDRANKFIVRPARQGTGMTIWLSPDFIDFNKRVEIDRTGFKESLKPSSEVILRDVLRRGDRRRPFWQKVEIK